MGRAGFVQGPHDSFIRWVDTRDEGELLADITALEAELAIANKRVELATIRLTRLQDERWTADSLSAAQADAAEIGRKLDGARHSLKILHAKRDDQQRAVYAAQAVNLERELGTAPPAPLPTTDERHELERTALLAELQASPAPRDMNTKQAQREQADALDPVMRARRGEPALDAIVSARNKDR